MNYVIERDLIESDLIENNKSLSRKGRFYISAVLLGLSGTAFAIEHDIEPSARLRYADLTVDGLNEHIWLGGDAWAGVGDFNENVSSALFRLSVNSQWSSHFSTFAQLDYVASSVPTNDEIFYESIRTLPDDPGLDVNQLYLKFDFDDYQFNVGRQILAWDNQRFIGTNGFWQNEQSFDTVVASRELGERSSIQYAYLVNANRIAGDTQAHQSHLLRAEINEWDYSNIVAYSYIVKNKERIDLSSKTVGLSYALKLKPNKLQYRIETDVAVQQPQNMIDDELLPYMRVDAGVSLKSTELSWRYEYLGAENGSAFSTPLGSLHEFNGWADMFTTTPEQGLEDNSLRLTWRRSPIKLDLRYHRFSEANGTGFIGQEFDFDIIYKLKKNHIVLLRFADFRVDESYSDTYFDSRRIMLSYSYNL